MPKNYQHKAKTVLSALHNLCFYCDGWATTIDHVIPRSVDKSLSNEWSNLIPACSDCNGKRGDMPIDVFLRGDNRRRLMIKSYCDMMRRCSEHYRSTDHDPPENKAYPQKLIDAVRQDHASGALGWHAIARKYNIAKGGVRNIVLRRGLYADGEKSVAPSDPRE